MKAYVIKRDGSYLSIPQEAWFTNVCKATLFFNRKRIEDILYPNDGEKVVEVDVCVTVKGETLNELCNEFRAEIFKKAEKIIIKV